MNGLPYYKRYPRDFIEGTIGMPFELKAAYSIVIDLIYMQNGALPDDARYISGLLGCSIRAWKGYREALLAADKIYLNGDTIRNLRVDKEIETLRSFQEKQRQNRAGSSKNKDLAATTVSPPRDKPEPDTEKKEREANASPKKGSRLPADWVLPRTWGEWAVEQGLSVETVRRQGEMFRDYWIAQSGAKAVKLDWQATWRNWIRSHLSRSAPRVIPQSDFWAGGGKVFQ
jgi:uncharacterized protein YdaU (DUF1376 family)